MTEGDVLEHLAEQVINPLVVLVRDFTTEPIHGGEGLGLVVATVHMEVLGQANLPRQHTAHHFSAERAPIHEVSVEQVGVLLRWHSVDFEDIYQVVVLAVNIATHCYFFEVVDRYVD